MHYGLMNPGTRRTSPAAYPTHARFDERGVETEHGRILRHRQSKEPATVYAEPSPPRHTSTLLVWAVIRPRGEAPFPEVVSSAFLASQTAFPRSAWERGKVRPKAPRHTLTLLIFCGPPGSEN